MVKMTIEQCAEWYARSCADLTEKAVQAGCAKCGAPMYAVDEGGQTVSLGGVLLRRQHVLIAEYGEVQTRVPKGDIPLCQPCSLASFPKPDFSRYTIEPSTINRENHD